MKPIVRLNVYKSFAGLSPWVAQTAQVALAALVLVVFTPAHAQNNAVFNNTSLGNNALGNSAGNTAGNAAASSNAAANGNKNGAINVPRNNAKKGNSILNNTVNKNNTSLSPSNNVVPATNTSGNSGANSNLNSNLNSAEASPFPADSMTATSTPSVVTTPASVPPALAPAMAPEMNAAPDPERASFNEKISQDIRGRIAIDLNLYCLDYCSVLNVDANSEEAFDTSGAELGFEGADKESAGGSRRFSTKGVKAEILVDTRFGSANIDRLQQIFAKVTSRYPHGVEIQWSRISFPDNGTAAKSENQVRQDFSMQVKNQLERLVLEFCPRECKINTVDVNIVRAGIDEVQSGAVYRYLFARDGKGALYVRGVTANVAINSEMDATRKDRIERLMREHLAPFGTVNLQSREIPFPKSAEEIQKSVDAEFNDPYGIERLGRMLKIFREYANTKEIIRERDTSKTESRNSERNEMSKAELERNEKSSSMTSAEREKNRESRENSSNSNNSNNSSTDSQNSFWTTQNMMTVGGIGLVLLLVGGLALRIATTGKQMQQIISEGMQGSNSGGGASYGNGGMNSQGMQQGFVPVANIASANSGGASPGFSDEFRSKLELQGLRDELIQTFITQPKVARDVFGRMLREEGIEYAARSVVIFGEMMVFELLGDADFKQDISTLAEYVHINAPVVEASEQLEMMRSLKLKMTAGKMRLMTTRTLDIFDFLKAKSARQIYDLVNDESARSQSMVLTQLPTEKRRAVFELFEGSAKGDLLRELCNSETVAREYLFNLAEALKRKAISKPGFEGENVQGAEVLLDLLERAELGDQRALMDDLDATNPESARVIRSRLVTVETLPFLRDGLLLEIFLSMDSNTMATFLAGTREHIRNLIISKAPSDIADDWLANLESVRSIDAEALRLAEMQVLSKIRSFAASGLISLPEINNSLYPKSDFAQTDDADKRTTTRRVFKISNPLVA